MGEGEGVDFTDAFGGGARVLQAERKRGSVSGSLHEEVRKELATGRMHARFCSVEDRCPGFPRCVARKV